MLLQEASNKYSWDLKFGEIAMIWRGGCIIKSRFLSDIFKAYQKNPKLNSLLVDSYFKDAINRCLVCQFVNLAFLEESYKRLCDFGDSRSRL